MRVPTVEKFLCCMPMQIGTLILGWIGMLWSTILIIALTIVFVWAVFGYSYLMDKIPETYGGDLFRTYSPILVKFIILIVLAYGVAYFYASRRLLLSSKTKNPSHVVPYMIFTTIEFTMSILSVFHFTWIALIQTIVGVIIYGYILLFVNSVRVLLKEEFLKVDRRSQQYQSAPLSVYKFQNI